MRFVSPLLKKIIYPALHSSGWLGQSVRGGCAVVNYHGVMPGDYTRDGGFLDGNLVSEGELRKQLRFLKSHYDVITPQDFRLWIEKGEILPSRAVLITCDDGLLNSLTDMVPVLQSENLVCLFFVTGASCSDRPGMLWYEELYHLLRAAETMGQEVQLPIGPECRSMPSATFQSRWWGAVRGASCLGSGARAEWMEQLRGKCGVDDVWRSERRWRLLNHRELHALAQTGMEVGAHTMTHPVLSDCSVAEAAREIAESKGQLERALGRTIWAFAYPFGNPSTMGEREVALAREAGYTCAFLNVGGGGVDRATPFALFRTHVSADMEVAELEAHLTGFHTRLQRAVRA